MLAVLAACSDMARAPARPFAEIGTRTVIKTGGREFLSEVMGVEDKLVTVEFRSIGAAARPIGRYDYYRGLLAVSGNDNGSRFEVDYDETKLETFFPVKPGKVIDVEGSMRFIDSGVSYPLLTRLQALKEKTITLDSGPEKVMIIQIETTLFEADGSERDRREQLVYFAPALSLVLKNVRKERGRESFWSVVAVERADGPAPNRLRRRRAGTVAI